LALHVDELARRQLAGAHRGGERLHDVGLRGDRVGTHHLRPAPHHRPGDRVRALDLVTHELAPYRPQPTRSPPRGTPGPAGTRPGRPPRCPWPPGRGTAAGSPPPPRRG